MWRKILLGILIALVGTLSVFMYLKMQEDDQIVNDYFAAIPYQSAAIIDLNEPLDFFRSFQSNHPIFNELKDIGLTTSLEEQVNLIDSITTKNVSFQAVIDQIRWVIAVVPTGMHQHALLHSVKIPETLPTKSFKNNLLASIEEQGLKPESISYENVPINKFIAKDSSHWYLCVHEGYLLATTHPMVIEDAIRQLNSEASLLTHHETFKLVHKTVDANQQANLYINQLYFMQFLAGFLHQRTHQQTKRLEDLSDWTALDLSTTEDGIALNGYTKTKDSTSGFLRCFKEQGPVNMEFYHCLPLSTSFFLHYGISNYEKFNTSYQQYLQHNDLLRARNKALNELQTDSFHLIKVLNQHLNGEVVLVIDEIAQPSNGKEQTYLSNKTFGILRIKNKDDFLKALQPILDMETKIKPYRGTAIFQLTKNQLFKHGFGSPFHYLKSDFLFFIGEYAVFTHQRSTVRDLINAIKNEKTLANDTHFASFSNHLSDQSNLTLYSNLSRSPYLASYFSTKKSRNFMTNNVDFIRKFEGFTFQLEHGNNQLFYNNIYLRHNPGYKKISSSLWETKLDTISTTRPMLFTNHYDNKKEIFVQDANHKVYLISNTGKILWSRNIKEPIMGQVQEVDKYKNKKYQILFNTKSKVYLLDRNGKNVEGFPINLSKSANQPVSLVDYDNNKKYRLFVPLINGQIHCFDISGNRVRGFKYKGKTPLNHPVVFKKIKKKDYLVVSLKNGTLRLLNRKGEDRVRITKKIKAQPIQDITIIKGTTLSKSYLLCKDKNGTIQQLSFNNKLNPKGSGINGNFQYLDFDVNGTKEYSFVQSGKIEIQDQKFQPVWEVETKGTPLPPLQVYNASKKEGFFYFSTNSNEVFVYDQSQQQLERSPYYGKGTATIYDINRDGRLELIVGGPEGAIFCYIIN